MDNASSIGGRRNRLGIILLTVLALLALGAMWRTTRKMRAEAASTAQFQALASGETAKLVLQVTRMNRPQAFTGTLLEKRSETVYRPTATSVEVAFDGQTKFVMGKALDVRTGAVLHVTGTVGENHRVEAQQLVILTEYVTVQ